MALHERIRQYRLSRGLSLAELSRQMELLPETAQAWEAGEAAPTAQQLPRLAALLGVSAAELLEEDYRENVRPHVEGLHPWEDYSANLDTEYTQSTEEGLDLKPYEQLFQAVTALPGGPVKQQLGQVLYQVVQQAPRRKDYPYLEPSELSAIKALRRPHELKKTESTLTLEEKLYGAWTGRICGCLLGKTVECIRSGELNAFLRETDNFPLHRYIRSTDLTPEMCGRYEFPFATRCYADTAGFMPYDDDTNYLVLAQEIVEKYGRDFTPQNVAHAWMDYQPKESYCTSERVAYRNKRRGGPVPRFQGS